MNISYEKFPYKYLEDFSEESLEWVSLSGLNYVVDLFNLVSDKTGKRFEPLSRAAYGRVITSFPCHSPVIRLSLSVNLDQSLNAAFSILRKDLSEIQPWGLLSLHGRIRSPKSHGEACGSNRRHSLPHCYLQHHAVFKESSQDQVQGRVVFDASCKTASGYARNFVRDANCYGWLKGLQLA